MDHLSANDLSEVTMHSDTSCEIVSPLQGSNRITYTNPNGKEVLLLLSGKMKVRFPKDGSLEMARNRPVVVEEPYGLYCPEGPGTGRALRISVRPS